MPRLSPLSSLTLPWATLKLAGRFAIPLVLWFTVGRLARYGLFYAGYRFQSHSVVPVIVLSFAIFVQLVVVVAMLHTLRDGLTAIRRQEVGSGGVISRATLAPWAARDEESIFDAMGRALFPFLVFYLAWGWFADDARDLISSASGRGFAEGGIEQQLTGTKILLTLDDHLWIAAIATVIFFLVKTGTDRWVVPRLARIGPLLLAIFELNWTLFGLFSIDKYRGDAGNWLAGRVVWETIGGPFGRLPGLWDPFKNAVLGALVWLVIAGVILGVDAEESEAVGHGRVGRRLAAISGIEKQRSPREILSRELRDKWFPAIHGFRMVRRAGWMTFGVFCVMFAGLDVGKELLRRGVFYLIGPHEIPFWMVRLPVVDFGVELLYQVLRICLLAAAFNLLVARVSARTAARREPSVPPGRTAGHADPAPVS